MSTEQEKRQNYTQFTSQRKQNQKKQNYRKYEKIKIVQKTIPEEYSGLMVKKDDKKEEKKEEKEKKFYKEKPEYYGKKKSGDTYDFKTKWKTEICHYWEMNGFCKYGDNCAFAHGENELKNRKISFNYKTKPCKQFFEIGFCPYGSRCQFSHKKEFEINNSNNNYNCNFNNKNNVSYLNSISDFLKSEKINEELLKRPRLLTFENIFHSDIDETKENRKKFYEDILNVKYNFRLSDASTISEVSFDDDLFERNRFLSV